MNQEDYEEVAGGGLSLPEQLLPLIEGLSLRLGMSPVQVVTRALLDLGGLAGTERLGEGRVPAFGPGDVPMMTSRRRGGRGGPVDTTSSGPATSADEGRRAGEELLSAPKTEGDFPSSVSSVGEGDAAAPAESVKYLQNKFGKNIFGRCALRFLKIDQAADDYTVFDTPDNEGITYGKYANRAIGLSKFLQSLS